MAISSIPVLSAVLFIISIASSCLLYASGRYVGIKINFGPINQMSYSTAW